jgi:membrane glycosyltransferase
MDRLRIQEHPDRALDAAGPTRRACSRLWLRKRPLTTETSPQGSSANIPTLCDENPARVFRRLSVLRRSIDATDQCEVFPYFILNDTSDPANIIDEALAEALAAEAGSCRLVYRRRMDDTDYEAGNIRDFGQ